MKFQIEWTSNVGLANDVLGFVSFHAWSYRRFKNNEKYFFNLPSTENWFIYLFCKTGFNNFHEKISQKSCSLLHLSLLPTGPHKCGAALWYGGAGEGVLLAGSSILVHPVGLRGS